MGFHLDFSQIALDDIANHKKNGNRAVLGKIQKLLVEISEHPFKGTGKPEALKHKLSGCWSRRINKEHRIIYSVDNDVVNILSLKGHYEKK